MNTSYWFKNKRVGTGWRPATWQGWLITALYISSAIFVIAHADPAGTPTPEILLNMFLPFGALTFLFIVIAWRTGEPLQIKFGTGKKEGNGS